MIDFNKTLQATTETSVTLVGYLNKEYPAKRGNCFSVATDEGDYRIINFNYENLEELLERKIIDFPITILPINDSSVALIADERIPNEWYSERFCETCTPMNLLPPTQRLKHILDIKRGKRTEQEIEINGSKMIIVSTTLGE